MTTTADLGAQDTANTADAASQLPPQPSVTVVVPTRDRPELLRKTIDSILGQDYPGEVKVLVVFDQSEPDRSLVLSGDDRSIDVISNSRSAGLAGARNSGILASSSDLVAFCDDDDRWLPGKLRAQVDALVRDPAATVASCGIGIEYDGDVVERHVGQPIVTLTDLLRSRMSEVHPSTFLMRRDVLLGRIGLVDEEIPGSYAEDYEWLLRAAKAGHIAIADGVHVRVLWHRRSYFASRWKMIIDALTWLLERYPEFQREPAGAARIEGQIAFASAASGDRRGAVRWARRTLRHNPRELRALLALAVAGGVPADFVLRELHKRGKGI